jgi:hypothetical protein
VVRDGRPPGSRPQLRRLCRTCNYCFKDICGACGTASSFQNGQPFAEILGCSSNACTGGAFVGSAFLNGFIDEARTDYGASRRTAHELGHQLAALPDEYLSGGIQCAHSIMGNDVWRPRLKNYCTPFNHAKDGNINSDDPKSNQQILFEDAMGPSWQTAAGNFTPDSFDYRDFDFNGQIGAVTTARHPGPGRRAACRCRARGERARTRRGAAVRLRPGTDRRRPRWQAGRASPRRGHGMGRTATWAHERPSPSTARNRS